MSFIIEVSSPRASAFPPEADQKERMAAARASDPAMAEKMKEVYDRSTLHKEFAERNKLNPLKAKPLKIVYVTDPREKQKVVDLLYKWQSIAFKNTEALSTELPLVFEGVELSKSELEAKERVEQEYNAFSLSFSMANQAASDVKKYDFITLVVDDKNQVQGVSLSRPSESNWRAWHIGFLVTASHNIRGTINGKPQVEGAGTALIEDAIFHSAKRNGLQPGKLSYETLAKIAVTLQANFGVFDFYKHVFFEPYLKSYDANFILTGDSIAQFFNKYGGRALSPS